MVGRAHSVAAAGAAHRRSRGSDVLAAVMADGVEPALGVESAAQIAVGDHDPLLVVQRPGDHLAPVGSITTAPAASEHLLPAGSGTGKSAGNADAGMNCGTDDDERSRLDRDVAHRGQPPVAVVGGRRDPDLGPCGRRHSGRAASGSPSRSGRRSAPPRRSTTLRSSPAADAVEQPLVVGRHQLAMACRARRSGPR